jgi:hypothetical protein
MLEIAKGKEELKPALERIEEAIKAHSWGIEKWV